MSQESEAVPDNESAGHGRPKRSHRKRKSRPETGDDAVIQVEGHGSVGGYVVAGLDSWNDESPGGADGWKHYDETAADVATSKPPDKRKKSKEKSRVGGDDMGADDDTSKKNSKKKNRSKSERRRAEQLADSSQPSVEDAVLRELSRHLHEDMVDEGGGAEHHTASSSTAATPVYSTSAGVWHTDVVPSRVGAHLYVQQSNGGAFKAMDRSKWEAKSQRALPALLVTTATSEKSVDEVPVAVRDGLRLHSGIQRLAGYCHGLLAGIALWQCVTVYQLSSPHFERDDFLRHYCTLAAVASTLFYLLLVVCIFALMARCDIGGDGEDSGGVWWLLRNWDSRLLALLIYWATLVLSLTAAEGDDALAASCRVTNSSTNHTLLTASNQPVAINLTTWTNLNLCRCLGSLLAYLLLSLSDIRSGNRLSERLRSGAQFE